ILSGAMNVLILQCFVCVFFLFLCTRERFEIMLQFQTLGVYPKPVFNHFLYGCNSKTNHCKYLKFSPNVLVSVIYIQLNFQKFLTFFDSNFYEIRRKSKNLQFTISFPSSSYKILENTSLTMSIKFFWLHQNTLKFNTKFLINYSYKYIVAEETYRNNASISNYEGGFRWQNESSWCIGEVGRSFFEILNSFQKYREKPKKKLRENRNFYTKPVFESIFLYGCNSKTNHCKYLKFSPNQTTEIFDFFKTFLMIQIFTKSVEKAKICKYLKFLPVIYRLAFSLHDLISEKSQSGAAFIVLIAK
ncbi:Uncharacterized protein FWK35_00001576, partial [Aphis craccivora]